MDAPETAEDHWNHDLHQRFPGFPAEETTGWAAVGLEEDGPRMMMMMMIKLDLIIILRLTIYNQNV